MLELVNILFLLDFIWDLFILIGIQRCLFDNYVKRGNDLLNKRRINRLYELYV